LKAKDLDPRFTPATDSFQSRVRRRLKEEIAQLPPEALRIYQACASGVVEQPCYRSEHYGIERVFVIARDGDRVLIFDDVEAEFAVGIPDKDGVLRDWELHGPLKVAVKSLPVEGSR
jgi:hypothetical protein